MTHEPDDFDLWLEVAKTVRPLRSTTVNQVSLRAKSAPAAEAKIHSSNPSAPHVHPTSHQARAIPHLSGFDRRTTQKMTRGKVEIERRLDLHGSGIEMARVKLLEFLRAVQAEGTRTALIVTGKGDSPFSRHTLHGATHYHAPERIGRLRRLVPEWLHEPEFRVLVSGFQPAHPRHGGGGAIYVKIRRLRGRT